MASQMDLEHVPSDTVLCLSAQIHISAPAWHVFDILVRGSTWPDWNSFCPAVEVTQPQSDEASIKDDSFQLGSKLALTVRMNPESPDSLRTQNVVVTEFVRPDRADTQSSHRVSWQALGMPRVLLRADRTSECVHSSEEAGASHCEFRTWEFIAGPVAYVVRYMYGDMLQARFEDSARYLKDYAERTWQSIDGQSAKA